MLQQIKNGEGVLSECKWVKILIGNRVRPHYGPAKENNEPEPPPPPDDSVFGKFILENELKWEDRLLLGLTLLLHIEPNYFTTLVSQEKAAINDFPNVLGLRAGSRFGVYCPTGLTFLMIAAGNNSLRRLRLLSLFHSSHLFAKEQIVGIEPHYKGEPMLSGKLFISEKWLELFLTGEEAAKDSIKYWSV